MGGHGWKNLHSSRRSLERVENGSIGASLACIDGHIEPFAWEEKKWFRESVQNPTVDIVFSTHQKQIQNTSLCASEPMVQQCGSRIFEWTPITGELAPHIHRRMRTGVLRNADPPRPSGPKD